jgi:hypothetical protein
VAGLEVVAGESILRRGFGSQLEPSLIMWVLVGLEVISIHLLAFLVATPWLNMRALLS